MGDLTGRPLAGMSGGEKQRVAFAAAVSSGAGLLLADEPTSQLSHDDRDAMVELIHVVNHELGTTVVLVTHDPEVAATCDEEIHLVDGRLVDVPVAVGESGPGHEHDLFKRPR
jgi:ABC-type lipoprotein export system ATPase subunit